MKQDKPGQERYRFDGVVVDPAAGAITINDEQRHLGSRALEVLVYLIENRGRVLEKREIFEQVWEDSFVTDGALTQVIKEIRAALDDDAHSPKYIRTVHRKGYQFIPALTPDAPGFKRRGRIALGRWAAGLGSIAILGLLAVWLSATFDRSLAPGTDATIDVAPGPSIAVLPFVVLSDDRTQTYFADGVSEEILSLLARQRGLKVIARTSSFSFRGRNVDVSAVAAELGVSHVLEGSLREDGDQIRINVQLIDAATGEYLWTKHFDRTLSSSNVFAIQGEIASAVSESLKTELPTLEYNRVAKVPTESLEALDAYFEGRAKMETRRIAQLDEASALFEKAIELDPDFALAHIALADVSFLRHLYGSLPVSIALRRIETSVDAALTINDQIGEAYLPLGTFLWWRYGDLPGAERAYLRGIELSPNYAPIYQWYATLLGQVLGRPHDAIAYAKMAVALDPRSAIITVDYATRLMEVGELDEAMDQLDLALTIDSDIPSAYLVKAWLLRGHQGEIAEAILLLEQAYRITPQSRLVINSLSDSLLDLGYFNRAEALIDAAVSLAPRHSWALLSHAYMQIYRGDRTGGVESARAALDDIPALPAALAILRDHYMREREHDKALELYRLYYPSMFDESSETVDLVGWAYPVAIDLSVLLIEMGRTGLAEKLLAAALGEAERRQRLIIGPPNPDLARIHALLGDTDAAMDALQGAVDRGWRAGWRLSLYHDAALDSLRDLPEFKAIVANVEADIERQRRELEARF